MNIEEIESEKSMSDCGSIVWRGRVTVNVYGALARPGVSLRSSTYLISVNVERTNKPKRGKTMFFPSSYFIPLCQVGGGRMRMGDKYANFLQYSLDIKTTLGTLKHDQSPKSSTPHEM